jgi:hypothetical protein
MDQIQSFLALLPQVVAVVAPGRRALHLVGLAAVKAFLRVQQEARELLVKVTPGAHLHLLPEVTRQVAAAAAPEVLVWMAEGPAIQILRAALVAQVCVALLPGSVFFMRVVVLAADMQHLNPAPVVAV